MADENIEDEDFSEEEIITYYFDRGFQYQEIRMFLQKYHGIEISLATLKRRITSFGLKRRCITYDVEDVKVKIKEIVDGHGCLKGYRSVWHRLQINGLRVPRFAVQSLLRDIDPEGTLKRRAHRLKRRSYRNPGPNFSWHCDGYDKLAPFGFPIHACVDGFSRKVLWLYVSRTNSNPNRIATFYLNAIREFEGCPVYLITDLGTENGIIAGIHSFYRDDSTCHRYVPSPRNQRIESWWSNYRRSSSTWWINFFKDLVDQQKIDTSSELEMECLWFSFSSLLQRILDEIKEEWNTHYIRASRHDCIKGRPDSLYYIPEVHGAYKDYMLPVSEEQIRDAEVEVDNPTDTNIYQEYFEYVMRECELSSPRNWREGLQLFSSLLDHAYNGT